MKHPKNFPLNENHSEIKESKEEQVYLNPDKSTLLTQTKHNIRMFFTLPNRLLLIHWTIQNCNATM